MADADRNPVVSIDPQYFATRRHRKDSRGFGR
jgi:hypothetical protein